MAGKENISFESDEIIIESLNRLKVEVVGWCIEDETVGILQLHPCYHTTHLLTTREDIYFLLNLFLLEEHTTKEALHHHLITSAIL